VLAELAGHDAVSVTVSVTTLDPKLHRAMEPRASSPLQRLRAIERLAGAGVPVGVNVAPVVPGLTDHEIPAILEAAAKAGAQRAGYIVLRLPLGVAPLFEDWLERYHPERAKKVVHRLESMRGGALNDPRFGSRMRGEGVFAEQIRNLFELSCRRVGLGRKPLELSCAAFRLAPSHPPPPPPPPTPTPTPRRSGRVGRPGRSPEALGTARPRARGGQLDLFGG